MVAPISIEDFRSAWAQRGAIEVTFTQEHWDRAVAEVPPGAIDTHRCFAAQALIERFPFLPGLSIGTVSFFADSPVDPRGPFDTVRMDLVLEGRYRTLIDLIRGFDNRDTVAFRPPEGVFPLTVRYQFTG